MQAMLGQEPPIHWRSTTAVDELAASSAAEDEDVVPFGLGHGFLHSMLLFACAGPMGSQAHSAFEAEHHEAVFAVRYMTRHLLNRMTLGAGIVDGNI
jgi:hypothetical protein